jgi:hypothetical protein
VNVLRAELLEHISTFAGLIYLPPVTNSSIMADGTQTGSQLTRASPSGRCFEFITVSGGQPGGDAGSRRRARSHAQADYRRRHPYQRQQREFELNISPLTEQFQAAESAILPRPATLLSASRSDPFATFNIGDSYRSRQLWDHGKYESLLRRQKV